MRAARPSSNMATPSRVSEKLANRNGPRHSVYWVQTKKASDIRLPTHSNVLNATNMGDASAKVEYTLVGKYTGDWKDGVKHGYGVLIYANGNKYEDDDDARHTFDDDDGDGSSALHRHHRFELPELELEHPEQVVSENIAKIRQERVLEKDFDTKNEFDEGDDGDHTAENDPESPSHEASVVVFDERTMRVIKSQFHAIEQSASENDDNRHRKKKDGCIRCAALPRLIGSVGLSIDEHELRSFLDELGASPDTLVSFAECVDILSFLAESEMGGRRSRSDHFGEDDEEYDEDDA
ncbi:N-carbamoylputrescine amidase, partial [Globisporangium splendens]